MASTSTETAGTITLEMHTAERGPTKVQRFLDTAHQSGLRVEYRGKLSEASQQYMWAITSGSDVDTSALWLYWYPGPNGGRLGITYYKGVSYSSNGGRRHRKATRREALQQLGNMRDARARWIQRLAERETADDLRTAIRVSDQAGDAARVKAYRHALNIKLAPAALSQVFDELNSNSTALAAALETQPDEASATRAEAPAVVVNVSDLSPACRLGLLSGSPDGLRRVGYQTTVDAMVRRGWATDEGNRWLKLTDQGRRARAALEATDQPPERKKTAPCGCWVNALAVEGHRQDCRLYALGLTGMREARETAEVDGNAPLAIQITGEIIQGLKGGVPQPSAAPTGGVPVEPAPAVDPTRPGWFMEGQLIVSRDNGTRATVTQIRYDATGKVAAVAVTINGGYGGTPRWYGDHPDAAGPIAHLEGPHIGLPESDRRAWPQKDHAASSIISNVLRDQALSGFARPCNGKRGVTVALPQNVDPERHVILLQRYVPYRCTVTAFSRHYTTVTITPRED